MTDSVDFGILAKASDETKVFQAGQTIFNVGDPASELYVVKDGEIEIHLGNRLIETLGAGGIFGELALIHSSTRGASARAKTDVALVPVSEKQFLFMVQEAPYFALNVMRVLTRRLRIANAAAV